MPLRSTQLMAGGTETIVARATADGRGALATIRVSGPHALAIAHALGAPALGAPGLVARRATRCMLRHPETGAALDDALVTAFVGPHSFTGEDCVEFSTHGGRVVPRLIEAACVAAGARPALPGEFTRRAVVNGKLDLVQAEAVADLIDARTVAMQQQALAQLDGGLSRRVLALRDAVIALEAMLAYDIDFPEEDDGPIAPARIIAAAEALLASLEALLATAPRATLLRDGALVVIAGPPNAGKSSLFNALLGTSRALVTPIAGTTRDAIDALLDRAPVPLRLVDTAGLRETDEPIERLGIEVSTRYLAEAQLVLACADSPDGVRAVLAAMAEATAAPVIAVHTKRDLQGDLQGDVPTADTDWCAVSAETGDGLAELLARIDATLAPDGAATDAIALGDEGAVMLTRERHQRALREAADELRSFLAGWGSGALPAVVAAVHLQAAREALAGVVGVIETEDILDRLFSAFCIGK
ncbi:MAG: tRNA uridine-5-carboxymethylaminomethyl(34) synthesis GTPase MnmE [Gemmatimonadaceae bacterium]